MSGLLLAVGAVDGDPAYVSQDWRQLYSVVMGTAPSGRVFGATSGVRDGVGSSIVTVTSTTWTVGAHPGIIDELDAVDSGAYLYKFGEAQTGSITAADSSNARVDRLDVQIVAGDGTTTTDSVAVVYTEGVPAASPVAPAAPDNSFPLGTISVPKATGGSPSFTWKAPVAGSDDTGWLDCSTVNSSWVNRSAKGRQKGTHVKLKGAIQASSYSDAGGTFAHGADLPAGIDPPPEDLTFWTGGGASVQRAVTVTASGQLTFYTTGATSSYYWLSCVDYWTD